MMKQTDGDVPRSRPNTEAEFRHSCRDQGRGTTWFSGSLEDAQKAAAKAKKPLLVYLDQAG